MRSETYLLQLQKLQVRLQLLVRSVELLISHGQRLEQCLFFADFLRQRWVLGHVSLDQGQGRSSEILLHARLMSKARCPQQTRV